MKKIISALVLSSILASSVAGCAALPKASSSVTASAGMDKYVSLLEERLDTMPNSLVIASGDDAKAYGIDVSGFADNEGYTIRASEGEVVILGKTNAGIDRAVRRFANYGNDQSYNYTYGEGYRVGSLTINGNDISEYAVIHPDDADECMNYAVDELVKFIEKTCGAVLPKYSETEYVTAKDKPVRQITLMIDYPALGDEAFTIDVKDDGNLDILCGRFRGGLYGVYGLLESIGWRFLGDDIQYLYEAESVDLTSAIDRTETAAIANRFNADKSVSNYKIGSKLHLHGRYLNAADTSKYGFYGIIAEACHGLDANRVDWKGTYDGIKTEGQQPCFTDEEVLQAIEDHFRKYIETRMKAGDTPGKELCYIDVAQFDTTSFCNCQRCTKVLSEEGATSGAVLRMTNRMADMAATYSPDIYALMLAYAGTNKPPKITTPRDNVKISYCFYIGSGKILCSNHNIFDESCSDNAVFYKEFEEWKTICKTENLQVWYYPLNCYEVAFQLPCFDTAYGDIKYLIDSNINCLMLCAGENNDTILVSAISKLSWNGNMTEEDYWNTVREYFDIVYGESGRYIYEYTMMLQTAGDLEDYWCAFHTNAAGKVNDYYISTKFDYMTYLFEEALRHAETEKIERQIEILMARMFYICIGITYEDRYTNGTDEERAVIAERYTEMHRIFLENNLKVFDDYIKTEYPPKELDLETNPFDSWCTIW